MSFGFGLITLVAELTEPLKLVKRGGCLASFTVPTCCPVPRPECSSALCSAMDESLSFHPLGMTIVLQNARKEDHQHTRPHRQREIDRHIRSLESWRGRESGKKLPANTQNGNNPRPKTANKNTKQNKKHCRLSLTSSGRSQLQPPAPRSAATRLRPSSPPPPPPPARC